MSSVKSNIKLLWASHRKNDPPGFRKLNVQNAILFLHFLTPAMVVIDDKEVNLTRNACIVYTPGIRQDYGAASSTASFENNFVTFTADTSKFIASFKVPTNEPFYINNPDEITRTVEWITWAAASREEPMEEDIIVRIYELFSLLEKGIVGTSLKNIREAQTKQRFIALRAEIMLSPKGWTVGKMAAACWLTRSRFYVVYKSFFGTSPSEDLAAATLEFTKERLLNTEDTVVAISKDCGYKRVECLIRMFSEKVGMTPGQYRRAYKIMKE